MSKTFGHTIRRYVGEKNWYADKARAKTMRKIHDQDFDCRADRPDHEFDSSDMDAK